MKKQILTLGKVLSKTEQKNVFGGNQGLEDHLEGACLSAGSLCHIHAHKKCCGTCGNRSGRWGVCK